MVQGLRLPLLRSRGCEAPACPWHAARPARMPSSVSPVQPDVCLSAACLRMREQTSKHELVQAQY